MKAKNIIKISPEKALFKRIGIEIKNHPDLSKFITEDLKFNFILKFTSEEEARSFFVNVTEITNSFNKEALKFLANEINEAIEEATKKD